MYCTSPRTLAEIVIYINWAGSTPEFNNVVETHPIRKTLLFTAAMNTLWPNHAAGNFENYDQRNINIVNALYIKGRYALQADRSGTSH